MRNDESGAADLKSSSPSIHHSSFITQHFRVHAFTMIEMLTTIAALVIVLGLMVSLARYVRERSAQQLTKNLLVNLDSLTGAFLSRHGQLPPARTLIASVSTPSEPVIRASARVNNEEFVAALQVELARSGVLERQHSQNGIGDLPISLYNGRLLADSWGNPIVFMADQHPAIGMAPPEHPSFFFSAGPDGKYLTREDNLYSYEQGPREKQP